MTTISKNARLSITALVFGAALITGFEAQAMHKAVEPAITLLTFFAGYTARGCLESTRKDTMSDEATLLGLRSVVYVINDCMSKSATRSEFHKCAGSIGLGDGTLSHSVEHERNSVSELEKQLSESCLSDVAKMDRDDPRYSGTSILCNEIVATSKAYLAKLNDPEFVADEAKQ